MHPPIQDVLDHRVLLTSCPLLSRSVPVLYQSCLLQQRFRLPNLEFGTCVTDQPLIHRPDSTRHLHHISQRDNETHCRSRPPAVQANPLTRGRGIDPTSLTLFACDVAECRRAVYPLLICYVNKAPITSFLAIAMIVP